MSVVDYASADVARRYAGGRELRDEVLDGWGVAVRGFLPARTERYRVLDVGAGTGIFARAWPSWLPCEVVALEPSAAMRTEMVTAGMPPGVRVMAGRAEQPPLRAGSVDVAWLSAVVHHLPDLDACARELRRVVINGGVVLIRGLFADGEALPALQFMPGWERAVSAFPTTGAVDTALSTAGLRLKDRRQVRDHGPLNLGEAAAWVRRLRHADSLLGRLTDDEIAAGLAILDARDPEEPLEPATLTLLAFERASG